jgi:glyoxylase-like metal-dependent hydrolase (beta-lactamase superfamily II)
MRFRKPGKIYSNLWYLGAEESGIYLLRGRHGTALINGGMSYILPDVLTQMREFGIDPGEITKFLILHSHFDHVGVVPYFKRNYPAIEVLASEAAVRTFENPKAIELINSYNRLSAGEKTESLKGFDLEWRTDIEPLPVREGDTIDLGRVALKIYETPGHSNCSISAYEPDEGVLFASDAMGIPFLDKLFPCMNTNIDQYLNSLEKLRPLKVNVFCADHYGYITGDEAGAIVSETIK